MGTLSTRDDTSLLEKEYSLASCRVTSSISSAAIVTFRVAFFGSGFIRSEMRGKGIRIKREWMTMIMMMATEGDTGVAIASDTRK